RGRGDHARGRLVVLSQPQARHRQPARGVPAGGDLLPPAQPAPGLRLPARLHRGRLPRRDHVHPRRRRHAGAAGLSSVRHRPRLRSILPERHGGAEARLALLHRALSPLAARRLGGRRLPTGRERASRGYWSGWAVLNEQPQSAVSFADKVRFLRQPESYPERPGAVEAIESHMSWVFLTERHAYKMKKPVRRPYLDYSTL